MTPSSISSQHQTDPLLAPKIQNEQRTEPLSRTNATAIKALAALRIGAGVALMIAPRWTCALFQFPVPAAYSVLPRLFGIRDFALGELLLTAEDKNSPDGGRREIKRALWAGIGCDIADAASIAYGLATGTVGRAPALLLAGSAALAFGVGAVGVRGL
jgi:hypothetical protein